jgi:hypothetical protein
VLIRENYSFEGLWKNGKKVKGIETNSSGIYKGEFNLEKREGTGEFEWFNG